MSLRFISQRFRLLAIIRILEQRFGQLEKAPRVLDGHGVGVELCDFKRVAEVFAREELD